MSNNFESIIDNLKDIAADTSLLDDSNNHLDKMLLELIRIEKRHLYGLDTTSISKRRNEIETFLDSSFDDYKEKKE